MIKDLTGEVLNGGVSDQFELDQTVQNGPITNEQNLRSRVHRVGRRFLAGFTTMTLALAGCTDRAPDSVAPDASGARPSAVTPGAFGRFTDQALALADPSVIGMSRKDLEERLNIIKLAGASGVRTDLSWRTAEATEGVYDWTKFDPVASTAQRLGIPVLAILDYAPPWAAQPGCDLARARCAPADAARFGDFAEAAVRRYAPQGIHTYELWNEQNISPRWSPKPDADAYAQMVQEVCPRIKQADPSAVVVLGGLALGDRSGEIPMLEFVEELYEKPVRCWDALSVHFYNPDSRTWALLSAVRKVMDDHADTRRIWATEVGVETSGTCGAANNSSERQQAAKLPEIVRTWRSYPWTGPLFWFTPQDVPDYDNRFGLTCSNGVPKPALAAFQKVASVG